MLDNVGDSIEETISERQTGSGRAKTRIRSETPFPYANLEEAIGVIKALHEAGDVPLLRDQLAQRMETDPRNGPFGNKIGAAVLFGLIEKIDNRFVASDLGYRAASHHEPESRAALVEAFYNVNLYRKLVEHFRGRVLPGKEGIESAIESFGVSPKLKERARWAFEKSALFAGYISSAKDRLVEPVVTPGSRQSKADEKASDTQTHDEVKADPPMSKGAQDPLISGLLARMPNPDKIWLVEDRARWLNALAVNLSVIYGDGKEQPIEIKAPSAHPSPSSPTAPSTPTKPRSGHQRTSAPQNTEASWEPSGGDLDDEIPF